MNTIISYVTGFWSVVIMNCVQPVNWQYCLPIHEWLIPDLILGVQIYLDKEHDSLYKSERDYLKNK